MRGVQIKRRTSQDAEHLTERKADLLYRSTVHSARYVEVVERDEVSDTGKDAGDEREDTDHRERYRRAHNAALAAAHSVGGSIARAAEHTAVALLRRAAYFRFVVVLYAALIVEAHEHLSVLAYCFRARRIPRCTIEHKAAICARGASCWTHSAIRLPVLYCEGAFGTWNTECSGIVTACAHNARGAARCTALRCNSATCTNSAV